MVASPDQTENDVPFIELDFTVLQNNEPQEDIPDTKKPRKKRTTKSMWKEPDPEAVAFVAAYIQSELNPMIAQRAPLYALHPKAAELAVFSEKEAVTVAKAVVMFSDGGKKNKQIQKWMNTLMPWWVAGMAAYTIGVKGYQLWKIRQLMLEQAKQNPGVTSQPTAKDTVIQGEPNMDPEELFV